MSGTSTPSLANRWKILSTSATFLVTLVGSFLIVPPVENTITLANLVRFLVAILVAVLTLPFAAPPTPAAWGRWAAGTVVLTVASVVVLFAYWTANDAWVIDYFGKPTVIGSELNANAAKAKATLEREGHVVTDTYLLETGAGDASLVWLPQGIRLHRFALIAIYLVLALGFSLAAFCAIHLAGIGTPLRGNADPPNQADAAGTVS